MLQMYKGAINSPETIITNNISNTDTLIYVQDETKVPTDLPNLMVLGTGISAETIKVLSISGLAITVERAFQGTAKTWNAGTTIARNFTEYDYEALKNNVEELADNQGDLATLTTTEKTNLVGAVNELDSQLAQDVQNLVDHVNNDTTAHGVENKVANTGDAMTGSLSITAATRHLDLKPDNESGWAAIAYRNSADVEVWRTAIGVQSENNLSFNNMLGIGELRVDDKRIYHAGNTGGFYTGNGSPEGTVTAPIGSIYQRKDGGANTTLYVKQSGTGNTGWVAK